MLYVAVAGYSFLLFFLSLFCSRLCVHEKHNLLIVYTLSLEVCNEFLNYWKELFIPIFECLSYNQVAN